MPSTVSDLPSLTHGWPPGKTECYLSPKLIKALFGWGGLCYPPSFVNFNLPSRPIPVTMTYAMAYASGGWGETQARLMPFEG